MFSVSYTPKSTSVNRCPVPSFDVIMHVIDSDDELHKLQHKQPGKIKMKQIRNLFILSQKDLENNQENSSKSFYFGIWIPYLTSSSNSVSNDFLFRRW